MTLERVRQIALAVAAQIGSAFEAKKRGEIVDFEIVIKSDGRVEMRTVRP